MAGGGPDAVAIQVSGTSLAEVSVQPLSLSPAYSPVITDYVLRCQPGSNTIQLTLNARPGGAITVGGVTGRTVTLSESLIENQALIIAAPHPNNAAQSIQYWVRCLPHDFPSLSVTDSDNPPAGWYLTGNLVPAMGSAAYAMVLDAHGTPV